MKESKVIFHIDVNSAYLSWEAVYRRRVLEDESTDLRDMISAVGGDPTKRHGIILAKSIPAKKYNIKTGDSVTEALEKCPHLTLVPPHYHLYERCSENLLQLLKEYVPVIEVFSIDECWCDMTGTAKLYGDPVALANHLKDRIFQELGFSVNIGISSNKLLAKMASDFEKPNKVHTLFPDEIKEKMWPLPVRELFFVGRATEKKLQNLGINTIGELAKTDLEILKHHLKKHGEVIWNYANGICTTDPSNITSENKGYGNSTTVAFDVTNIEDAKKVLMGLSEMVCTRLRKDHVFAEVVSVELTDYLFFSKSHQKKILTATNTTNEFYQHILQLFYESWDKTPLRKLGVRANRISKDQTKQYNLFDVNQYERCSKLDVAIDGIRSRYGKDAIMRATFLNSPVHHMIGGVSPDKGGETEYVRRNEECRRIFQST